MAWQASLRTRAGPAAVLLVLAAILSSPAAAATPEAQVKAAYLYKLASFVRWPEPARQGQFTICIAGRSDVASVLQQLVRGQQVGGRPMAVAQVSATPAGQARDCAMLFVGRGADTAHALISATRNQATLTVGDRDGGTAGGVVDFLIRDGRVRLAVDRRAATDRHLEISSKLLDVAVQVAE